MDRKDYWEAEEGKRIPRILFKLKKTLKIKQILRQSTTS